MRMESPHFHANARRALNDRALQKNLAYVRPKFISKRQQSIRELGEEAFEKLRTAGEAIRQYAVTHLAPLLTEFEQNAQAQGTQVLWAKDVEEAQAWVLAIAREHQVKKVVKSKSMLSEELGINQALAQAQIQSIETDLGEYILQINNNEPPVHIIAPAMHKSKEEISALFSRVHQKPALSEIPEMTQEARKVLREHFLTADMGISGANFLVAQTGSTILVTNEGNGRMCTTLPRVHITLAGIEKVVPTLADAAVLLRLLTRSATGQMISNYVSVLSGVRRAQDREGPRHHYVILVDAKRSTLIGTPYQAMLQCIRCGACMNHCPVFHSLGGHAYGWVYPGPMGSVLTPLYQGLQNAHDLPQAATLCNQCGGVCPVNIPLAELLRQLREDAMNQRLRPWLERFALRFWAFIAIHPTLYRITGKIVAKILRGLSGADGQIRAFPFAGKGWTIQRTFPAPEGVTFRSKL